MGDVKATAANTELLESWIDYAPFTKIETGIERFAYWYKNYISTI